jgi:hypothetical protein
MNIENIRELKPNSIVIVKLDRNLTQKDHDSIMTQLERMSDELRRVEPTVMVLAIHTGIESIDVVSETDMNRIGWYRKA